MQDNVNLQAEISSHELGPWETILVWIFFAIVIGVGCIFYNLKPGLGAKLEDWGQFGDSFGMINWTVSLLSLGGVVFTAISVKDQIKLIKKQIEDQRMFNKAQLELQAALELINFYNSELSKLPTPDQDGYALQHSGIPGALPFQIPLSEETKKRRLELEGKIRVLH
ncbi:MAG TPA: hypothetical protein PK129_13725, partial [Cellvibrionaceae bacterium]|nr:hypothetical protein [Cellvibrionaceae bacterium]